MRVKRGGRRELRHDDQIAAVELRNKADRGLAELVHAERDNAGIDDQHHHSDAHEFADETSRTRARACRNSD